MLRKPLRTCNHCGLDAIFEEDLNSFIKDNRSKYGRGNLCRECAAKKRSKWAKKNRDSVNKDQQDRKQKNKVRAIKQLGSVCEHCGLEYNGSNAPVFDFHHLDPNEKEYKPSDILRCSWTKIEEEISKCVLLCANCHRLEHQPRF